MDNYLDAKRESVAGTPLLEGAERGALASEGADPAPPDPFPLDELGQALFRVDVLQGEAVPTFIKVNDALCRMLGYSRKELEPLSLSDLHPGLGEKRWPGLLSGLRRSGALRIESVQTTRDGREMATEIVISRVEFQEKEYLSATVRDLSPQKRAERNLTKQHEFLWTILKTIPHPIFFEDAKGRLLGCNDAFERFAGLASVDIVGRTIQEISPLNLADFHRREESAPLERDLRSYEARVMARDGRPLDVILSKAAFSDSEGRAFGVVGVVLDVTSVKAMERQLLRANEELEARVAERTEDIAAANSKLVALNEELFRGITAREQLEQELEKACALLASLVGEVNIAEEKERRRIATELHDHVVQDLALGQMKLAMMAPKDGSAPVEFMTALDAVFDGAIKRVRQICFDLSPPLLYELGLPQAIASLGEHLSREHGFWFSLKGDLGRIRLPDDMRVLLYQTVRELMVNAIKHARAKEITVRMRQKMGVLQISVVDDGVGFAAESKKGFGLSNIKQRIGFMKGHMKIHSHPGHKTEVEVVVPVARPVQPALESEPAAGRKAPSHQSEGIR